MRRFDFLTSQFSDIKTTLLKSIINEDLKETARGVKNLDGLIISYLVMHKRVRIKF
jgi:hypothetical protein